MLEFKSKSDTYLELFIDNGTQSLRDNNKPIKWLG